MNMYAIETHFVHFAISSCDVSDLGRVGERYPPIQKAVTHEAVNLIEGQPLL